MPGTGEAMAPPALDKSVSGGSEGFIRRDYVGSREQDIRGRRGLAGLDTKVGCSQRAFDEERGFGDADEPEPLGDQSIGIADDPRAFAVAESGLADPAHR